MTDRFRAAMASGPLLLDAAMGTRLVARGLHLETDDPALWTLTAPEVVAEFHRRDVRAGATVLLTNTFGANHAWLRRFGRADAFEPINRQAVALARHEAGPSRYVIGSIGPTAVDDPRSLLDQAGLLVESGVDGLIFETHRLDQAEQALELVMPLGNIPRLVSLYQWPEPIAPAVRRLVGRGASAIGLNCVIGMEPALQVADSLRAVTQLPLIVKPSASRPGVVPASPKSFAAAATAPRIRGLAPILVGGCCGTDESYLAALSDAWYHQTGSCPPAR